MRVSACWIIAVCLACAWAVPSPAFETDGHPKPSTTKHSVPDGAIGRLGEARFLNYGRVFALAFSPDSKLLGGGSWDGVMQLWDVKTQNLVRSWQAHPGRIKSLAFSPDGKLLASAGKDKKVRLWHPQTGQLAMSLEGHAEEISFIAFSPSGKHLLSRSFKELRVWDISGKLLHTKKGRIGSYPYFSADGAILAYIAVSEPPQLNAMVVVMDIATGEETRRFPPPVNSQGPMIFSPTGRWVTRNEAISLSVVETNSRRDHRVLERNESQYLNVSAVAFSPDERLLAAAAEEHRLAIIELASRKVRCEFRSPDRGEISIAFSPNGRFLATGSLDRSVLLWDLVGEANDGKRPPMSAKDLDVCWTDLNSADGRVAQQAIWRLVANPEASIPFLEKILRGAPAADDKRIGRLIRDLESDSFAARRQAFDELEKLNDSAESALRKSVEGPSATLESRRRVEDLLGRVDAWWEQQWRLVRAIEVLERIGGAEAVAALDRIARTKVGTRLGREAEAVLRRGSINATKLSN